MSLNPNPELGEVEIELIGGPRILRYTSKALKMIGDILGLDQLNGELPTAETLRIDPEMVVRLLHAGLIHADRTISVDDVDLLFLPRDIEYVAIKCMESVCLNMGTDIPDLPNQTGGPQKNQKPGTGKSSRK